MYDKIFEENKNKEFTMIKQVNIETGEISYKNPKLVEYDSFLIKKNKKYSVKNANNEKGFFNLIVEFQKSLKDDYNISFEDLGRLFVLFTYTDYRDIDNKRLYLKENRYMINNKKMEKILKLSPSQIKKFKSRMKEKGLMNTDKKGIYFNDNIIIRGEMFSKEKKNLNFYTIYDTPIRELYNIFAEQNNSKSVKPLGVLLTLIPFIKKIKKHERIENKKPSNNMLVMSEWNKEAERYEPISLSKLAQIIGVSRQTLTKDIKTLNDFTKKNTGEFLIYKYESSMMPVGYKFKYTTEAIIINPKYTYSQDNESDDYYNLIYAIENINNNSNIIDYNN